MRVYCQQDASTKRIRAHGCGPVSGINALVWASGGDWQPDDLTDSAEYRIEKSGASDAEYERRGLTSDELFRSMVAVTASDERMDLPVQQRSGARLREVFEDMNATESGILIAVHYGVVQDAGKGVTSYRGFHWVYALDHRASDDTNGIADPLRRQVVRWPAKVLIEAAGRFGDKRPAAADESWPAGQGELIQVWRWPTWRAGYASMAGKRDAAVEQRDFARRALAVSQAALTDCQANGGAPADQLAAARAKGIADAAAAAEAVK